MLDPPSCPRVLLTLPDGATRTCGSPLEPTAWPDLLWCERCDQAVPVTELERRPP